MQIEPTDNYLDVNVKARYANLKMAEQLLLSNGAHFVGEDIQVDTFYQVHVGKMKLREGTIENLITHYLREIVNGEWQTRVFVYEKFPPEELKKKLLGHLPVLSQVRKTRRIFFIGNVKFHLDRFDNGDSFVEIEAIDKLGTLGVDHIRRQADEFSKLLSIQSHDILTQSYVDLYA